MPEIRALTLHQPWASLVAWGVKHYETRPRPLSYRGPLAIHAAKAWSPADEVGVVALLQELARLGALSAETLRDVSGRANRGCVVAVADMVACERMAEGGGQLRDGIGLPRGIGVGSVSEAERLCGDWRPGRYAYRLANVRRLETPIPARGKQGLWRVEVPEEVLRG